MKLFIDTSQAEKITLRLDTEVFEAESKKNKSQYLLAMIETSLKQKGKELKDIKEIEVNTGPGSFTGIRVGLAVANTIGYFLGISVNGKDIKKGETVKAKYE